MPYRPPRPGSLRALPPVFLALVVGLATLAAGPSSATARTLAADAGLRAVAVSTGTSAASASSLEASLLAWTNRDRAARGLKPLRRDVRLAAIADKRATNLASASTFSHAAAGPALGTMLQAAGVQWYAWAEDIAWWPGGLNTTTAAAIYGAWKRSASHWAQLMSARMNYVAFGLAVRATDGRLYASAVFTESRDHTAPYSRITSTSRSGTTIAFAWRSVDPSLQTHWAGLRDWDVWYRVDAGAWRLLKDNTTATSLRLGSRAHGHRYWLAVQPRDRAGNVGRRSTAASIWVP